MTAQKISAPLMRYHGGKFRLADWVISHFPEHKKYVEPFGGAASVLMKKPRCYAEIYNDLDSEIVNVFRVIRDRESCDRLIESLIQTPYSRDEFELAFEDTDEPVERSRRTLYRAQSGFGSAGATKGSTGWRNDSDRDYGLSSHLWARYPDTLSQFCDRLSGVIIENRPAIDVMQAHDSAETLHFVDPPYLWETRWIGDRKKSNGRFYRHEMSDEQHKELLAVLTELEGMVIVSGYSSEMYNDHLTKNGWKVFTKEARISAYRGTKVKTECIWVNPACYSKKLQTELF